MGTLFGPETHFYWLRGHLPGQIFYIAVLIMIIAGIITGIVTGIITEIIQSIINNRLNINENSS